MSLIQRDTETKNSSVSVVSKDVPAKPRKVLEEEEYLDHMSKIIKRDFFTHQEQTNSASNTPALTSLEESIRSDRASNTPKTDRTCTSSIRSVNSRCTTRSMRLNEFLEKYNSEDNAYFDKLQRKDLKKHRTKYPWLYSDRNDHNKRVRNQLKLGDSLRGELVQSTAKMIDWHYNPKNTLFYPPSEKHSNTNFSSTVNYDSNKYVNESLFKAPLPVRSSDYIMGANKYTDKIGIDGKLLSEAETPSINDYLLIPPPEAPRVDNTLSNKRNGNRYFIPCESPRDELAHRLYEEKVAKKIRTPRSSTRSDSTKTPMSRLDKIF